MTTTSGADDTGQQLPEQMKQDNNFRSREQLPEQDERDLKMPKGSVISSLIICCRNRSDACMFCLYLISEAVVVDLTAYGFNLSVCI